MDPGFGIVIIIPVVLLAHILREIRRIRQIAEATHLGDQILVMARGRLWAKYPNARFDILTSSTFDLRSFSTNLIMYTGDSKDGWVTLLKTRGACSGILEALEELQEKLAIYIIEHEDDIKQAFDEAVSPPMKGVGGVVSVIPPRKVPYIDRLDGRVVTRCAAM